MFPLVSGRHVGAHPDGHQHGGSIQISINLGKKFLRISCIRKIAVTWNLRESAYSPSFFSQNLDFIYSIEWFWFLFWMAWHWKPAIPPPPPRGRRLLPEKLGGGVPPAITPYPIWDQNLGFSLPYLWPVSNLPYIISSHVQTNVKGAKLQNAGPLLIIHQTSAPVWLVCPVDIHCWAKRATKYIDLWLSAL